MRTFATLLLTLLLALPAVSAEPPRIPLTNEVVRYERVQPIFRSTQIPRERGDALLSLLDGGRAIERWMKDGLPPGVICALPPPARIWIAVTLTNGTTYRLGLSHDGRLLDLPTGLYVFTNAASTQVPTLMAEFESDLRQEILNTPKPCTYKIGTCEDGGTLSGVARLFYGDATKWPRIYEANRSVLKNPHQITGMERLTIPKL